MSNKGLIISQKEKHAARKLVKYYVKTGKLKKLSCEYEGCDDLQTEGHHPDYNFPLEVIWLCQAHHRELHRHVSPIDRRVIR